MNASLLEMVQYVPPALGTNNEELPDGISTLPIRLERILAAPPSSTSDTGLLVIFDVVGIDPLNVEYSTIEERNAWMEALCKPHHVEIVMSGNVAYVIHMEDGKEIVINREDLQVPVTEKEEG